MGRDEGAGNEASSITCAHFTAVFQISLSIRISKHISERGTLSCIVVQYRNQ